MNRNGEVEMNVVWYNDAFVMVSAEQLANLPDDMAHCKRCLEYNIMNCIKAKSELVPAKDIYGCKDEEEPVCLEILQEVEGITKCQACGKWYSTKIRPCCPNCQNANP